jgi:Family of unknown function (DUF5716)
MESSGFSSDKRGRSLAALLFREASQGFFGILSSPNAPLYVDALDTLEHVMSAGGHLSRGDAIEVLSEVLRTHPECAIAEEFPNASSEAASLSGQANLILRRLIETGWLHEPQRPDYQRLVSFDANGEILLAALRQIARGEQAQFTDKLQIACGTLLNVEAFVDQPLADLEGCLANFQAGLRELRQMQKSIERHTRNLIAAQSLREVHQVLYDEFSEHISRACYRELVRAQLPTKLLRARQRLDLLAGDEAVLEKMQGELLRRDTSLDATDALNRVRLKLDEIIGLLDSVQPQANDIDDRAAEFARRSFARFRYLQQVTSSQREHVQILFEWTNKCGAGGRLNDLDEKIRLPDLLLCEVGLLTADSLYTPKLRRSLEEIDSIGDDLDDAQRESALADLRNSLRDSLSVTRANQFVEQLPGGKRISTADMPIHNDHDIADVIACLLHAGSRDASFVVTVPRVAEDMQEVETEQKAGYMIERFILEKK